MIEQEKGELERKIVSGIMLTLLLIGVLTLTFSIQPVIASLPVHNIDTGEDFATIQAAIDDPHTLDGHAILVDAGTYYEHVNVTKILSLIGENPATTIIDGSGSGIVVSVKAADVEIRGFTIQNSGNTITDCGIYVANHAEKISNNVIRNSHSGIWLHASNGSNIIGNTIWNNTWAVYVSNSNENIIHGNTITNNHMGVWITSPSSLLNTFYRNNIINNTNQVRDFGGLSKWDNGAEGNYWSDYAGEDLNGDGIGDTLLPHQGIDNYPLMRPYMEGDANHDGKISITDIVIIALAFRAGAQPGDPDWNPNADLNGDGKITITDVVTAALAYRSQHT